MSKRSDKPFERLERIFHEPHRLAIMSSLLGVVDGLTFNVLKRKCELTDGNLSRHLKALEGAGAVRIKKTFVGNRPCTTVYLSKDGHEQFMKYLEALERIANGPANKVFLPLEAISVLGGAAALGEAFREKKGGVKDIGKKAPKKK